MSELITIAWTQLQVEECSAVGNTRCHVQVQADAAVVFTVAVTLSLRHACKHVASKVPSLACTEWEANHVHSHSVPHAIGVGIGSYLSTSGWIVEDRRDNTVLLHVHINHCHKASLVVLVEVAETHTHAMVESGLQLWITNHDVQWVTDVGHWLQLCYAGLVAAHAVVDCNVACLTKFVTEACKRCNGPCPACRDVSLAIDKVGALRHCRGYREAHIKVIFLSNLLVTNLEVLIEELVAEVVTLLLVEYAVKLIAKFHIDNLAKQCPVLQSIGAIGAGNHAAQSGISCKVEHNVIHCELWHRHYLVSIACDIIHTLGRLGHAVVGTVRQRQELCLLHIAQRFCPAQSSINAIGLTQVVIHLIDGLILTL